MVTPPRCFGSASSSPIRDIEGRIVAFGGRTLDQREPKYLNSPEPALYSKSRSLYGIYEARKSIAQSDRANAVEGYLDVLALHQAGITDVVGVLGTAFTADQLHQLARRTKNI